MTGNLEALIVDSSGFFYFKIWNSSRKVKTFDIQCCEKHGKVYEADGEERILPPFFPHWYTCVMQVEPAIIARL